MSSFLCIFVLVCRQELRIQSDFLLYLMYRDVATIRPEWNLPESAQIGGGAKEALVAATGGETEEDLRRLHSAVTGISV